MLDQGGSMARVMGTGAWGGGRGTGELDSQGIGRSRTELRAEMCKSG